MKRLLALLSVTLFASFGFVGTSAAADAQAGREFTPINPPVASPADKIEVVEFFSYGCPHCSDFHPIIGSWVAKLPKDVSFRRIPVSFNRPEWARLAKIFYSLEATGNLAKLDTAVFIALHEERVSFKTDDAVFKWVAGKGADAKKFTDVFTGFSMQSRVQRGDKDASAAGIGGVPSLMVDGKYLINNKEAASYEDLLRITDLVIDKARKDRKSK